MQNLISYLRDLQFIITACIIPIAMMLFKLFRENKRRKDMEEQWRKEIDEEVRRLDELAKLSDEYKTAIKTLLRESLKKKAATFLNDGKITTDELTTYHDEYALYKKLGGNGVVESLTRQVDNLPVKDDGLI